MQRVGGGIEQGAQDKREGCFAAGGRTGEEEDGIGAGRSQGGEEPRCHAVEGGRGEEGSQGVEESGSLGAGDWAGQWAGAVDGAEAPAVVGGDAPVLGRDFDDLAGGVGEIDGDGARVEGVAGPTNAGEDFLARAIAEAGVRLDDADGVTQRMVRGEDAVFVMGRSRPRG